MSNAFMKSVDRWEAKFSNRREWRAFIASVPCIEAYPKMLAALRASAQRFHDEVMDAQPVSARQG
jgi:hypothetical protein